MEPVSHTSMLADLRRTIALFGILFTAIIVTATLIPIYLIDQNNDAAQTVREEIAVDLGDVAEEVHVESIAIRQELEELHFFEACWLMRLTQGAQDRTPEETRARIFQCYIDSTNLMQDETVDEALNRFYPDLLP